jgi:glycosyltransferase involved in cell wall biosynthesis
LTSKPQVQRVLRASPRVLPHLGGQEIHVAELTRCLAALGIDQTLVFAEGEPELAYVRPIRRRVPPIPSKIVKDALFGAQVALFPNESFQVVHTHGDAPVARGGEIAARRLGAVHVHTFHGDLVARGIRATVLRTLLPKRSWYLAVSRDVAKSLVLAGANREQIFIRTSGVREEFFRPSGAERSPDVIVGGRLIPEKRIGEFVRAWADGDTGASRLQVFGSGPEAATVEEIAQDAANVVWLGQLDAVRLSELLTSVSVGVVTGRIPTPRKSNEGTPTLALEMLAAGCFPIVGSLTGDAPRLVHEFRFGQVCDEVPAPHQVAALAATWSRTAAEEERTRVRSMAGPLLSWSAVAVQIRDLYARVLDVG